MTQKTEDKKIQKDQPIELNLNPNLSPVWIDNFNIGIRDDNICFIRFSASLPEGIFEQYKIMTTKEHLKEFIDSLCSALEYYPDPSDMNKNKTSRKQKK